MGTIQFICTLLPRSFDIGYYLGNVFLFKFKKKLNTLFVQLKFVGLWVRGKFKVVACVEVEALAV